MSLTTTWSLLSVGRGGEAGQSRRRGGDGRAGADAQMSMPSVSRLDSRPLAQVLERLREGGQRECQSRHRSRRAQQSRRQGDGRDHAEVRQLDVLGRVSHERPARALPEVDVGHAQAVGLVDLRGRRERDRQRSARRTKEGRGGRTHDKEVRRAQRVVLDAGVVERLRASECVSVRVVRQRALGGTTPHLAVAVDRASAVHQNVISAEEDGGRVELVRHVEDILGHGPVVDVGAERQVAEQVEVEVLEAGRLASVGVRGRERRGSASVARRVSSTAGAHVPLGADQEVLVLGHDDVGAGLRGRAGLRVNNNSR